MQLIADCDAARWAAFFGSRVSGSLEQTLIHPIFLSLLFTWSSRCKQLDHH